MADIMVIGLNFEFRIRINFSRMVKKEKTFFHSFCILFSLLLNIFKRLSIQFLGKCEFHDGHILLLL